MAFHNNTSIISKDLDYRMKEKKVEPLDKNFGAVAIGSDSIAVRKAFRDKTLDLTLETEGDNCDHTFDLDMSGVADTISLKELLRIRKTIV